MRTIISLTSIPPRFSYLSETLNSIVNQTADIEDIILYIPRKYKRFEYDLDDLPQVPSEVKICITEQDFGPATKILPAAREYAEEDVAIIFCDDDKIYDPNWAGRLINAAQKQLDCAIVEERSDLKHISIYDWSGTSLPRAERIKKDFNYRLRRVMSLGKWKPRKNVTSGYVDILEGWGGVLIYPRFFTQQAFDIPSCAWMVDDIWLSGQLEVNGIKIWLTKDEDIRTKGGQNELETPLRKQKVDGHGRFELNQGAIEYFLDNYKIWQS